MKKLLLTLIAGLLPLTTLAQSAPAQTPAVAAAQMPVPPTVAARAWIVYDVSANQILASSNPDQIVEPASLTKLMTAYVVFNALKNKSISNDQLVTASEKAWRTGGSRMFIDIRKPVSVSDLIHGMIIQSGNDACIALAETVAGTEERFVGMMNREAQRLGLKATKFTNTTGLTEPGHTTSVRDLVNLSAALIRDFPEYYPIYSKRDFTYNNIKQENRNRLLWTDPSVDGMKTGHTDAAGYNLVASAKRGPRRLISVVTGTTSESARAQESQKLLNFGFQAWDAVKLYGANQPVKEFEVWKGAERQLKVGFRNDFVVAVPRDLANALAVQLESRQPLIAPVKSGDRVGTLKLTLAGQSLGEYPVVALQDVAPAGIFRRAWDSIRLMLK
ncbi:MAG: D-alanyl-D-alanine carboxypeptidase family protein [Moraxellaceae bacterium]|nr:D-alanyl-D-alanine carboxypeptidase family protein [Moraxellaceae bacterium]